MIFLIVFGVLATSAGIARLTDLRWPEWFDRADQPPPLAFPVLEPSRPTRLTIPALKVEAPVQEVGLARDGSIAVPPVSEHNEAGWYADGPSPGQFGPAVIVGHADTRTGPSIFFGLERLKPGDTIEVSRADRDVAVFRVDSVEQFGKSRLPVDRVYADFTRPYLRLITCGGAWKGGSVGYEDNIVVFASLTGTLER